MAVFQNNFIYKNSESTPAQGVSHSPLEEVQKFFGRLCISVVGLENLNGIPKSIDNGWDRSGRDRLAEEIKDRSWEWYITIISTSLLKYFVEFAKTEGERVVTRVGAIRWYGVSTWEPHGCWVSLHIYRPYSHDVSPRSETPSTGIINPINSKRVMEFILTTHWHVFTDKI